MFRRLGVIVVIVLIYFLTRTNSQVVAHILSTEGRVEQAYHKTPPRSMFQYSQSRLGEQ